MKVLCLSDIHGIEWYVDVLIDYIKTSKVTFDCVVVGGDISSDQGNDLDGFCKIMSKISTLGKDTFYCLGNWDSGIPYDCPDLGSSCHHIHDKIIEYNGYYFSGFSGCDMGWGNNPIYLQTESYISKKYSSIIQQYSKELEISINERTTKIDALKLLPERYGRYRSLAATRYGDKRTKTYKNAIEKITSRERVLRERAQYYESPCFRKFLSSTEYQNYRVDCYDLRSKILEKNIGQVVNNLKEKKVPLERLIFLSHSRVDRFAEYFDVTPFCHMFGHRHGYMSSYRAIRGQTTGGRTNFINISTLGVNKPKKFNYFLPPNFVIAELKGSSRIDSKPIYLDVFNSRIPINEKDKMRLYGIQFQLEEYYLYERGFSINEYRTLVDEFSEFVNWHF
ncbi:metallophosphoesterase [Vibrio sp. TH_r3]|uniref:metallophosphoesterase family protein n=1 Tax=Vibrio sp. TH_r3 TaxID=3082084 RepID=UPI0029534819|nr:metallophosphoesterase [Vibrio sp. TH_r3]MDV7105347.1 metallophosphoesterase [Vibrio sp. TH_r3]